jgi:hypothetical protein
MLPKQGWSGTIHSATASIANRQWGLAAGIASLRSYCSRDTIVSWSPPDGQPTQVALVTGGLLDQVEQVPAQGDRLAGADGLLG